MDSKKLCFNCMQPKKTYDGPCLHCGFDNKNHVQNKNHLPPLTLLHNRYIIGNSLGSGGFGITYIAMDKSLEIVVAIKELFISEICRREPQNRVSPDTSKKISFKQSKKRFLKEARAIAMSHNNDSDGIVAIRDFFEENNTSYIVMEYLNGITIEELVKKEGPMRYSDTLSLMEPVCNALATIHSSGLIHKDVSPSNIIIIDKKKAKILDFGSILDITKKKKKEPVTVRHGYSPYEQYFCPDKVGPYTDVYSAAATMYYCLTGKQPADVLKRRNGTELIPPLRLGAHITRHTNATIMKALEIYPENRYCNMQEFLYELHSKKHLAKYFTGVSAAAAVVSMAVNISNKQSYTRPPKNDTSPLVVSANEINQKSKDTASDQRAMQLSSEFDDLSTSYKYSPDDSDTSSGEDKAIKPARYSLFYDLLAEKSNTSDKNKLPATKMIDPDETMAIVSLSEDTTSQRPEEIAKAPAVNTSGKAGNYLPVNIPEKPSDNAVSYGSESQEYADVIKTSTDTQTSTTDSSSETFIHQPDSLEFKPSDGNTSDQNDKSGHHSPTWLEEKHNDDNSSIDTRTDNKAACKANTANNSDGYEDHISGKNNPDKTEKPKKGDIFDSTDKADKGKSTDSASVTCDDEPDVPDAPADNISNIYSEPAVPDKPDASTAVNNAVTANNNAAAANITGEPVNYDSSSDNDDTSAINDGADNDNNPEHSDASDGVSDKNIHPEEEAVSDSTAVVYDEDSNHTGSADHSDSPEYDESFKADHADISGHDGEPEHNDSQDSLYTTVKNDHPDHADSTDYSADATSVSDNDSEDTLNESSDRYDLLVDDSTYSIKIAYSSLPSGDIKKSNTTRELETINPIMPADDSSAKEIPVMEPYISES